jgi:DNA-binding CsgD family transcriptional regulator
MLTAHETLIPDAKQRAGTDRAQRWAAPGPNVRRGGFDLTARSRSLPPRAAALGIDPAKLMALREAALAAEEAAAHARTLAGLLETVQAVLTDAEPGFASAPPRRATTQPDAAPLSPREREVWALVAEGRSNKAIAAVLFVSPNTVKTHVASLLAKLNADTRVQLAAMAARHEAPEQDRAEA